MQRFLIAMGLFVAGLVVILIVMAVLGVRQASAHDWYDRECCDARDCEAMPTGGTVEDVPGKGLRVRYKSAINGYLIDGIIPYAKIRPSRDGQIHPCQVPPLQSIRCLYMPFGA
jgi:hypothetical protein